MHIGWWYFTISHVVLVTNLVLVLTVEECSAKATRKEERTTVWETHFGVQPRLDQYHQTWITRSSGCLPSGSEDSKQHYISICGYVEDINDNNEEEDEAFDVKSPVRIVTEALPYKHTKIRRDKK